MSKQKKVNLFKKKIKSLQDEIALSKTKNESNIFNLTLMCDGPIEVNPKTADFTRTDISDERKTEVNRVYNMYFFYFY